MSADESINFDSLGYVRKVHHGDAELNADIKDEWDDFLREFGEIEEGDAPWGSTDRLTELMNDLDEYAEVFVASKQRGKDRKKPTIKSEETELSDLSVYDSYRRYGHLNADLDPLGLMKRGDEGNLLQSVSGSQIDSLRKVYCGSIGAEFMHLESKEEREWIATKMESKDYGEMITADEKRNILKDIVESEQFEQFLHTRFVGAKRFSGEGLESVVVCLEKILEKCAGNNCEEVVVGMAHRGRLNILSKVAKKEYAAIFYEFKGNVGFPSQYNIKGDVKYHMGHSSIREFNGQNIRITMCANPSHLEAVNPVASGFVRSRQDEIGDSDREKVVCVLLHGDASFAGQGVVYETIAGSNINGYRIGGTIHIICNNQIGFTAETHESRSTRYATDLAKYADSPIFHVNGYDPEAVFFVSNIALEYKNKFKKDVYIDVISYRKYGHNETDEPNFTQPNTYKFVRKMELLSNIYSKKIGVDKENIAENFVSFLEGELERAESYECNVDGIKIEKWKDIEAYGDHYEFSPETGVSETELLRMGKEIASEPQDIVLHKVVKKLILTRLGMLDSGEGIDWGLAEALSFASIAEDGIKFRLTGQDSIRGTFSHRHSMLSCQEKDNKCSIFRNLNHKNIEIVSSYLSEYAVMGFEYGYSVANPDCLAIWEGQFGDFVNGAQIVIDQFIASAETKWLQNSNLVLLLPHGYEGQGSEHTSGRMERFLQLAGENNMQIVNCTTPANYFHVLRRQNRVKYRKPLIVFTPKSLLRYKLAVSDLKDMGSGTSFLPVIEDKIEKNKVSKLILCTGKVYYDLLNERKDREDVSIVRLEQLYPFPSEILSEVISSYCNLNEVVWLQEEPKNMGGWQFINERITDVLKNIKGDINYPSFVGRGCAATPSTGYMSCHNKEQEELIAGVFS